jgi:hypothetical protein
VVLLTGGNVNDITMFESVMAGVAWRRPGPGRPANRPDGVLADKGYSSKANRAYLRRRGIHATIAERRDQQANRARRGSAGGRPGAAATAASASPASLLGSRSGPAISASTRAVYLTTDLRDKCSAPAQAITPMAMIA